MLKDINNLKLDNFTGPMDLLLKLVQEKKMDILKINLLDLANEYLKIIANLKNSDLNLAVEYLVMATYLLRLKTQALLAEPKSDPFVQNSKKDLLNQLIRLQQFKNSAKFLKTKELERKNFFIKPKSVTNQFDQKFVAHLNSHVNVDVIAVNLRKMFERTQALKTTQLKIQKFSFSPAQRREQLLELFKMKNELTFIDIFSVPSINHFSVTVITVLDMSRKQEIILHQTQQFGEIKFQKGFIDGL